MNLICLKIFNALSFLGLLATFYSTAVINNNPFRSIINVTDTYNNSLVPPKWSQFSVWNISYIFLLVFTIIQFFKQLNRFVTRMGLKFILFNLFNIGWLLTFTLDTKWFMIVSVFFSGAMLTTLAITQYSCNFFDKEDAKIHETLYGSIPISIMIGWCIYLVIMNITIMFMSWNQLTVDGIYYTVIITALFLVYFMNLFIKNNYPASIIFLFIAVSLFIKNRDDEWGFYASLLAISITCFSLVIKLALHIHMGCCNNRNQKSLYNPKTINFISEEDRDMV